MPKNGITWLEIPFGLIWWMMQAFGRIKEK